jgi:hypothetical protein
MTGQPAQICLACWIRFSRSLPRSFHGWKNWALGIPRQAASSCQAQFSLIGGGACWPITGSS